MNKNYTITEKKDLLLDFLANKELSFGCEFKFRETFTLRNDVKPVRLYNAIFKFIHSNIRGSGKLQTSDFRRTEIKICSRYGEMLVLDCGNEVKMEYFRENLEIIGHKVMIGDVLQAMEKIEFKGHRKHNFMTNIVAEWQPLGFTKSLNEILDSEIEENYGNHYGEIYDVSKYKDKNIQNLLDFLWDLFGEIITNNIK